MFPGTSGPVPSALRVSAPARIPSEWAPSRPADAGTGGGAGVPAADARYYLDIELLRACRRPAARLQSPDPEIGTAGSAETGGDSRRIVGGSRVSVVDVVARPGSPR